MAVRRETPLLWLQPMAEDQTPLPSPRSANDAEPIAAESESSGPVLPCALPDTDAERRLERRKKAARRETQFLFGVISALLSLIALAFLAAHASAEARVLTFVASLISLILLFDKRWQAYIAGFFTGIALICLVVFGLCGARF